jgi:hypothetical protein
MKKIVFALVALMFAAPAWAQVSLTCAQVGDTNEVVISFDARGEPNLIRAFGLNIQLDNDANILSVGNINPDYYIFPGTIQINTSTTPPTIDYGTPVGEVSDSPDTLPGLDSNGVTLEMGSLYAPTGPGSPNAPDPCGPLLSIYLSKSCCISISGNVARAGSKGVVMEDPAEDPTVNATGCCAVIVTDPLIGTCWSLVNECGGQNQGDATCDGSVNLADLMALKGAWGASAPWTAPKCCADFNQDGSVNLGDLMILKAGWGSGGHTPATGVQACP